MTHRLQLSIFPPTFLDIRYYKTFKQKRLFLPYQIRTIVHLVQHPISESGQWSMFLRKVKEIPIKDILSIGETSSEY